MKSSKQPKKKMVRKVRRSVVRRKERAVGVPSGDLEGLLISEMANLRDSQGRTIIHDLIYNSTESMRNLAYRHGFSVGKELFDFSGEGKIDALLAGLKAAGMEHLLYTPAIDAVIIKNLHKTAHKATYKNRIHIFEAGVIAGYLSTHTSTFINAKETHCTYYGDGFCEFVASGNQTPGGGYRIQSLEETVGSVSDRILVDDEKAAGRHDYVILSLLPVLKEPIIRQVSKLFFLIGENLAGAEGYDDKEIIKRIAGSLGVDAKMAVAGKTFSVRIGYNDYNSMRGFVELSTKAFIGFLSKRYSSVVSVRKTYAKNGYFVTLSLRKGM